jgi:hypothetical protein
MLRLKLPRNEGVRKLVSFSLDELENAIFLKLDPKLSQILESMSKLFHPTKDGFTQ